MKSNITKKVNKSKNMSKISNKGNNSKANNNHPAVLAPQIDKLSGVINFKDEKLFGQICHEVLCWLEQNELGVSKARGSNKYPLSVIIRYPLQDGLIHQKCPCLLLQLTSKKSSKLQIRVEYNPYYMTEVGEDHLNVLFQSISGLEFYELLAHAVFTRVDLCRDILLSDINDYLIQSKWSKFSQCFFNQQGKLQTVNLGKSGNNQITAYDKSVQLYGDDAVSSTIRIEAKCRINLNIYGLARMANPFKKVEVYSVECKNPPFGTAHWRGFQDSCRIRGVGNATKHQPADYRKDIKKALARNSNDWWQIKDEDWSWLLTNALEDSGLTSIPNYLTPLSHSHQTGDGN